MFPQDPKPQGICLRDALPLEITAAQQMFLSRLGLMDLESVMQSTAEVDAAGPFVRFTLCSDCFARWTPQFNTLDLRQTLHLNAALVPADLLREIVIAMLVGPVAFEFPSVDEWVSATRIRANIAQAGCKTSLAFHTSQAERPQDCWTYREGAGFVIRPGASLMDALAKATQPAVSNTLYSFSCYRATEYVMLLGIAQELAHCNPALYAQLQALWTERPIMSGQFHEVFLREQGSMELPLPAQYFVPGDRTWFRNPDAASSEASGYEGSWVIYLGGGHFSNFWKCEQPYTLVDKCLEIYHWRNALYFDDEGEERIDEAKVEALLAATRSDAVQTARILGLMQRFRDGRGVYAEGGCIDTTREFARWVCPASCDLLLPQA